MRSLLISFFVLFFILGCDTQDIKNVNDNQTKTILGVWKTPSFKVRYLKISNEVFKSYVYIKGGANRKGCYVVNKFAINKIKNSKVFYEGEDSPLRYHIINEKNIKVKFNNFATINFKESFRNTAGLLTCSEK